MGIAALMNALGDVWFLLCVVFSTLRTAPSLMFAAVLKGLGGGAFVIFAGHSAFVAETSTTTSRSYYLGLMLVMFWVSNAVAPLISSILLVERNERFAACFAIAIATWGAYFLYLVFVLRESRNSGAQSSSPQTLAENSSACETDAAHNDQQPAGQWTPRIFIRSLIDPLILIFTHPTLRWLGIADFAMSVAQGAFGVLVPYCIHIFSMSPIALGTLLAINSISRAVSVLCILPAITALYRFFASKSQTSEDHDDAPTTTRPTAESEREMRSERTPLLVNVSEQSIGTVVAIRKNGKAQELSRKLAAAQELIICRICFVIDALGMIFVSISRNPIQVSVSTALGSMGAPAGPSLGALISMTIAPDELGRVFAGFTAIESAAVAMRNPLLFGMYELTLESHPGVVWWVAAVLFFFCAVVMSALGSKRFARKPSNTQAVSGL